MKKIATILSIILIVILLFGCQSNTVSSEDNTTSPESSVEATATLSYEHTAFNTKEELFDFLRQNSSKKSVNGASIQNFIKENQITIFEPTFTPPEGFHFYCVEIWSGYSAYIYVTDAYIDHIEETKRSVEAAAQTISVPQTSFEIKVESSETGEIISSGETTLSGSDADLVFEAENMIIIHWCTAVREDPLSKIRTNPYIKSLGNNENPKYYYAVNNFSGSPISYGIYWDIDGHSCYAHIPAALFSEEAVNEICSFKTVTMPLG